MANLISRIEFSALMCPAIAKTSDIEIIRAASSLVEKNGPEGLVLRDVAELVGIKTPSLYKRFADRNALLRALREHVQSDLHQALDSAAEYSRPAPSKELVVAMAYSYRNFAKRQPELYRLLHRPKLIGTEAPCFKVGPLFAIVQDMCGPEQAKSTAACLESLLHGLCTNEINGQFQTEADADEAFALSMKAALSALHLQRS